MVPQQPRKKNNPKDRSTAQIDHQVLLFYCIGISSAVYCILLLVEAMPYIMDLDGSEASMMARKEFSTIPLPQKKARRARYTNEEKMNFVQQVKSMVTPEFTARDACEKLGKLHLYFLYYRWRKLPHRIRVTTRGNAKSIATGRPPVLKPYEGALLCFISKLKQKQEKVTTQKVLVKANSISSEFRVKTVKARRRIIQRFMLRVREHSHRSGNVEANVTTQP
jgi:hypothetical protein